MKEKEDLEDSNMKERIITALVLLGLLSLSFYLGSNAILLLVSAFLLISAYEIYHIRRKKVAPLMLIVYISIVIGSIFIPTTGAIAYISMIFILFSVLSVIFKWFNFKEFTFAFTLMTVLVMAVLGIRNILAINMYLLLYVLIAAFATDTLAFFGGKQFGKNKLIPRVSPNKTVEGAISGYIGGVLLSFLFGYFVLGEQVGINPLLVSSLLIPALSQFGDLVFSLIKRTFSIKDFGFIFPGHGGALDRIDSLIFAIFTLNIVLTLFGLL